MSKLHLKRTPAEEAERLRRRANKAARKVARKDRQRTTGLYAPADGSESEETPGKKRKREQDVYDDGYDPPLTSRKPDHDSIRAAMDEVTFREKMWDALEDDERLDAVDSRFRSYHIPDRWRGGCDNHLAQDPHYMDDDEYAEWIREGMWRRKHAREYEERSRKEAEKAALRAREAKSKAETARMEKAASERREQTRREKERLYEEEYRQSYERRWKGLSDPQAQELQSLTFEDIPWPLFPLIPLASRSDAVLHAPDPESFTIEAISKFLIPGTGERGGKQRREKLKESMLRFHPDKFDGRVLRRVLVTDRDRVKEAVNQVVRILNTLMNEQC